jgi:thiol-disulfide isomerase/thioredoxin
MRRFRPLIVALALVLAVFTASPAPAQDTVESLNQRVQALEKRIASLEQMLAQRLTAIEQKVAQQPQGQAQAQPSQPNPQEQAAQAAFGQINQLVASGDYDKARTSMVEFMKTYSTTRVAGQARKLNEELQVIGKDAPTTWGIEKWYQGEKEVDLKAPNKTTLVVFWEEWCPHCRREVPKLEQTYEGLKGNGLQVVGFTKVTRNVTDEQVTQFLTEQKVSYPIAKEDGTLSTYFGVSGIPAAAVVKNGKVIWRGHPAQLDEAKLKSWL